MIICKNLKCTCCGEKGTMREFKKIGDELVLLKEGEYSKDNYRRFVCSKCSHVDFYWSCVERAIEKDIQAKLYEKFVLDINKRVSDSFLDIAEKLYGRFNLIYDRLNKAVKPTDDIEKDSINKELALKSLKNKVSYLENSVKELRDVIIYIGPFSVINDELKLSGKKGIEGILYDSIAKNVTLEYDDELKAVCDYILSFKETGVSEIYRVNAEKRYKESGYEYNLEDAFYKLMNFKFAYTVAILKEDYLKMINYTKADDYYLNNFDKQFFDEIKVLLNDIEIPNI